MRLRNRTHKGELLSEQATGSVKPTPETVLKRRVLLPVIDVLSYRRTNYFGHRARFNICDGFQRFCLLSRQTNGHGFDWFHTVNIDY
jgi:hypothetical protein